MAEKRNLETDGGREAAVGAGTASSPHPMPVPAEQRAGLAGGADVDAEDYITGQGPATRDKLPSADQLRKEAEEREKLMARSRGVPEEELDDVEENTAWVMSYRADDRNVIWERDRRHPGGEVLIGSSGAVRAYKTAAIQERLFRGELVEVKEPKRYTTDSDGNQIPNRKFPQDPGPDPAIVVAAQPGRPTPLGRRLDPELWEEEDRREHARKLRGMPSQIGVPQGAIVPTVGDVERSSR
jgi:hypothetical protein